MPPTAPPERIPLARLPTPLEPSPRLGRQLGLDLWWKRDDLTGLELSGNKARKLPCGSGGTAAGVALGLKRLGWTEARAVACAVCDDAAYFRRVILGLAAEAARRWPGLPALGPADVEVDDRFLGPGYAQATPEGLALLRRVARTDGLILDPVYTGKAFLGLCARAAELGTRVIFLHTGGAFGLLPLDGRLLEEGSGPAPGPAL